MKTILPVLCAALVVLLFASPGARAQLELKSWLGSAFTVPGEQTELWLWVLSNTRPDGTPQAPRAAGLSIRLLDDHTLPQSTRERLYLYQFSIGSYAAGTHTVPPFELTVNGEKLRSQPVELHVAPLPDTAWNTDRLVDKEFRFASTAFVPKRVPYEGETISAEAKVYLPEHLAVTDASIAELEHDGVVAWRFESSKVPITSPFTPRLFQTKVRMGGQDYRSICYRSTVTAIRTGAVSLGPGHARLTFAVQVSNRGINLRQNIPRQLEIPKIGFEARALPPNAPPGFENAVGRFSLSALADTAGLQEGDPISLRVAVSGIGNLDALKAPQLTADESDWKTYPPSRLPRQGERRDVSGVVTFSQIIRPIGAQRVIPPFRLVVFNPEEERYDTISTAPTPFEVRAAPRSSRAPLAVLPNLSTPVEEMEGILGLVDPSARSRPHARSRWWRFWHLLPAGLAIALLIRIVRRRVLPRFRRSSREQAILRDLAFVDQSGPSLRDFLRASGRFIESWIPGSRRDEEIEALLERRDRDCYRPDAAEAQLAGEERSKIIRHLRERASAMLPILLLATLVLAGQCPAAAPAPPEGLYQQAQAAWNEGSYRAAIELYQSAHPDGNLPADLLYNIGNCHFQLQERGLAALFYHRALSLDPHHAEARQNLRFLKRKTGAITIPRPAYQETLGKFDRALFRNLMFGGLWLTALAALGFFAALSKALRALVWTSVAAGPLAALAGLVTLYLYPRDAEFAPIDERGIVVSADLTTARTEASSTSEKVISVPPGSLCRPLARRGPWTYLELADGTRGWLPSQEVRMILPARGEPRPAPLDLGA